MPRFRRNDGFTLIEVIISIAILSLVSVVTLQLFITAQSVNTNSRHRDIASTLASNCIEAIKTYDNLDRLLSDFDSFQPVGNDYLSGTDLDEGFQALPEMVSSQEGSYRFQCQLVAHKDVQGLYTVKVDVLTLPESDTLISYSTKHYFKEEVSSHVQ